MLVVAVSDLLKLNIVTQYIVSFWETDKTFKNGTDNVFLHRNISVLFFSFIRVLCHLLFSVPLGKPHPHDLLRKKPGKQPFFLSFSFLLCNVLFFSPNLLTFFLPVSIILISSLFFNCRQLVIPFLHFIQVSREVLDLTSCLPCFSS